MTARGSKVEDRIDLRYLEKSFAVQYMPPVLQPNGQTCIIMYGSCIRTGYPLLDLCASYGNHRG